VNRHPIAAAALLLLLAACPLPQTLPDYAKGTVTPPRIVMDGMTYSETIIQVPAACAATATAPSGPTYPLDATLIDNDTSEKVTARWFVDYQATSSARCFYAQQSVIAAPSDTSTERAVPTFTFVPYDFAPTLGDHSSYDEAGIIHVVELVVSNQFDTASDTASATLPYRTPAYVDGVQFETQTFRWVFVTVPQSASVVCQ
jgi:hypothetical protein